MKTLSVSIEIMDKERVLIIFLLIYLAFVNSQDISSIQQTTASDISTGNIQLTFSTNSETRLNDLPAHGKV